MPRVMAFPDRVYPPALNVIELNVAPAARLFVEVKLPAPAGKTRSSLFAAAPVGTTPPSQLAAFVQFVFPAPPPPVQVIVAGVSRVSSCSRPRPGNGRRHDGLRFDQPVHRRGRGDLGMGGLQDRLGGKSRCGGREITAKRVFKTDMLPALSTSNKPFTHGTLQMLRDICRPCALCRLHRKNGIGGDVSLDGFGSSKATTAVDL
jgi:hypothetical protein